MTCSMLGTGMMSECTLGGTCNGWNVRKAAKIQPVQKTMTHKRNNPYHKDDCGCGCKHVLATDGTVAFQVSFDAFVSALERHGHANVAFLAMEIVVLSSNPANPAVSAMINVFSGVIIP
jgi:hypothetical protein